jgi:hypothetical protein
VGNTVIGLMLGLGFAFAGTANAAVTLGSTAQPAGSGANTCGSPSILGQHASDPSTPYVVPAGGGAITGWQTNTNTTAPPTPGANIELVVLRLASNGDYIVVGVDPEQLPNPLPGSGIASYTLSTPIIASAGDRLGLYAGPGSDAICSFTGGPPSGNAIDFSGEPDAPASGQVLTMVGAAPSPSTLNVSATLDTSQDLSVTTGAGPANAAAGQPALLSSTVATTGPDNQPIAFTDTVPEGLTIAAVSAGFGTCATSGQTVTCTISGLPEGQSAPVNVVVRPNARGTYTNSVSVSSSGLDPTPGDNAASAKLVVGPTLIAPGCIVPKLRDTPGAVAKHVLELLGCTVKLKRSHNKFVAKRRVIKTSPKAGSYAAGEAVTLILSSGR